VQKRRERAPGLAVAEVPQNHPPLLYNDVDDGSTGEVADLSDKHVGGSAAHQSDSSASAKRGRSSFSSCPPLLAFADLTGALELEAAVTLGDDEPPRGHSTAA
jgi:hypothetical protein